jgi:hypothetical protein
MTNASELKQWIRGQLPRCPEPVIDLQINATLIDFFRSTRIWRSQLAPMGIDSVVREYPLELEDDLAEFARLYAIESVVIDTDPNTESNAGQTEKDPESYTSYEDEEGCRILCFNNDPGEDIDGGLLVTVAVVPLRSATKVPTHFFEDYFDGWCSGVLNALLQQSGGKPYAKATQQELARTAWNYKRAIGRAKNQVMLVHGTPRLATRRNLQRKGAFQLV